LASHNLRLCYLRSMMYVVHVEQNALRARSDPMEAATALKVAKAWQSHGDRAVRIIEAPTAGAEDGEAGAGLSGRSWSISEFIAFVRGPVAARSRAGETARNTAGG
jgi:hypothetical protein